MCFVILAAAMAKPSSDGVIFAFRLASKGPRLGQVYSTMPLAVAKRIAGRRWEGPRDKNV
jgi:hypothetical protein